MLVVTIAIISNIIFVINIVIDVCSRDIEFTFKFISLLCYGTKGKKLCKIVYVRVT